MLKIGNNLLISEAQIAAAELVEQGTAVKVTFTVPDNIPQCIEGNPHQALFTGYEAKDLWRLLSKDAEQVRDAPAEFIPPFVVGRQPGL
jgi:hypothetical protein